MATDPTAWTRDKTDPTRPETQRGLSETRIDEIDPTQPRREKTDPTGLETTTRPNEGCQRDEKWRQTQWPGRETR